MSILEKYLMVQMPDESKWAVPIRLIAEDRASAYAKHDEISFDESLNEDTVPLFESDDYEIHDWAANNMNWNEVKEHAICVETDHETDYQEGWCNGEYTIIDAPKHKSNPLEKALSLLDEHNSTIKTICGRFSDDEEITEAESIVLAFVDVLGG